MEHKLQQIRIKRDESIEYAKIKKAETALRNKLGAGAKAAAERPLQMPVLPKPGAKGCAHAGERRTEPATAAAVDDGSGMEDERH